MFVGSLQPEAGRRGLGDRAREQAARLGHAGQFGGSYTSAVVVRQVCVPAGVHRQQVAEFCSVVKAFLAMCAHLEQRAVLLP